MADTIVHSPTVCVAAQPSFRATATTALFCVGATALAHAKPPLFQCRILGAGIQNAVGALDQQCAQIAVAGLGNVQLWILAAALLLAGT